MGAGCASAGVAAIAVGAEVVFANGLWPEGVSGLIIVVVVRCFLGVGEEVVVVDVMAPRFLRFVEGTLLAVGMESESDEEEDEDDEDDEDGDDDEAGLSIEQA